MQLGQKKTKRRQPKKRCLSDLYSMDNIEVFESAKPPFPVLLNNLSKEVQYVVKIFRNKSHCFEEIFTYALLALCFERKNYCNSSLHLDYVYELIQKTEFEILLPEKSQLRSHTQINIKNLISQYLNFMNQKTITVQDSLKKYPLMLQIFVFFFRTLLYLGDACTSYEESIPMLELYDFLTSYFEVQMALGENYLLFNQANIFVTEIDSEVFMIIPAQPEEVSSFINRKQDVMYKSGISSVKKIMESHQKEGCKDGNKKEKKKPKKISIENGHTELTEKPKKVAYEVKFDRSNKVLDSMDNCEKDSLLEVNKNHYRNKSESYQNLIFNKQNYGAPSQRSVQEDTKTEKNFCQFPRQEVQDKKTNRDFKEIKSKMISTDEIFYRPSFTAKAGGIQCPIIKPWINKNISKEFTSSIILECLPQPYRSSIKGKKQRARQLRKSAEEFS